LRLPFKEGEKQGIVVYMEKYYGDPSYQESIADAVRQISVQLGIEACKAGNRQKLHSFGSSVPYEYCDADHRGVTNGVFSHQAALLS